jgi:hypothetical protein
LKNICCLQRVKLNNLSIDAISAENASTSHGTDNGIKNWNLLPPIHDCKTQSMRGSQASEAGEQGDQFSL